MGNHIYGKPKPPAAPIKAAPSLQEQIILLERRKTYLEKRVELEIQNARNSKTKDEGIRHLKLKQMYEAEIKSIYGMLDRLEGLDNAKQRMQIITENVRVTQQATQAIKANTVDADKVQDTLAESQEVMEDVDRVSSLLGRTESPSEELQNELDNLLAAPKQEPPALVQFPEVPKQEKPETDMEKELRILVPN